MHLTPAAVSLKAVQEAAPHCPEAACRAMLYGALAELLRQPPKPGMLDAIADRLGQLPHGPDVLRAAARMLAQEARVASVSRCQQEAAWTDFRLLLDETATQRVSLPYAHAQCDEMAFAHVCDDVCPYEAGKPCPFGDTYCVDRLGAPCDHVSAALEVAAHQWNDLAEARDETQRERCRARCTSFAQRHLRPWVSRVADALHEHARSSLYRCAADAVDLLIDAEPVRGA
ncbi:MAG: molecular chaperone TorD family protein [Planctomycetes bacterium]|nr:molecular chaperone TorD family protein [Planctomycetota bacterium]